MRLIGHDGQTADALVMTPGVFVLESHEKPVILETEPESFGRAKAWIEAGVERILLDGLAMDRDLAHEMSVGLGRQHLAVRIPVSAEGGVLTVTGTGEPLMDYARQCESRWGDQLWLEPETEVGASLLAALDAVAAAVKVALILITSDPETARRAAGENFVSGIYAPGNLEAVRDAMAGAAPRASSAFDPSVIRWDDRGLVPVITQDVASDKVLMLAYMNRESLALTLEKGEMVYYSRSRQELWHKGATSGHFQRVYSLWYDCDADTLLARVEQTGAACHTGSFSCFTHPIVEKAEPAGYREIIKEMEGILDRKANPRNGSYTNKLLDRGVDTIAKKVVEEACEVVLAAKNGNAQELTYESCDLLYHLFVLLAQQNVSLADLCRELEARRKK